MATLQASESPTARVETGNKIIERAKTVDTSLVKKRLSAFASAHKIYVQAEKAVLQATAAQHAQEQKVGEADVAQDHAVDALASAMVGDGAPRTSPFRVIQFPTPTEIKPLGYAKEAALCMKLAKVASSWKPATKITKSAASALAKDAALVASALKPLPALQAETKAALARRESYGLAWATSLAALKRGVRAAEDEGAKGLFAALFSADKKTPANAGKASKTKGASPPQTPPTASS